MKKTAKNNKGFSLVELIVVVLIMGIIAVALAPQVMKWVGTSKENTDADNAANLKSSINTAIADYMATNSTTTCPVETGKTVNGALVTLGDASLTSCINEVLNAQWPKTQAHNQGFLVEITATGAVKVYYQSNGSAGSFK